MRMTKPILWLLCLCTAMPFGAKAQSTMTYTLNFDPSDFTIKFAHHSIEITSKRYKLCHSNSKTFFPEIYYTLLLPSDAKYNGLSYAKNEKSL